MARFACATWRPISVNYGGKMSANLGLVLHHQGGNGGLYGWFNNPSAKVSAHFWAGKGGQIEQYVDSSVVAWHGMSLNSRYVAVETEGCAPGNPNEPLTEAQINAVARIYAEGARLHGWRNALANADGQAGFGYHRMAVSTACPNDARLSKRPEILKRAFGGAATAPPPSSGGGAAPAFRATPYIDQKTNSRHPDVRDWQAKMRSRGWSIGVDGAYGPESERVCRAFQSEKRLGVDGKVGPQTWSATWTAPVT
jgi:hypothetical protein